MSMFYLSANDFVIDKQIIYKRTELTFILFYDDSERCRNALRVFSQLVQKVIGCRFAIVNLNNGKNISLSRATDKNKIPAILAFNQGQLIDVYSKEFEIREILTRIEDVSRTIRRRFQSAADSPPPPRVDPRDADSYSTYEKAYSSTPVN